jgi:hypothetical protein
LSLLPSQSQNQSQVQTAPQASSQKEQLLQSNQPPFPERLALEKPITPFEFDLMSELKNLCIKIPLLQAIKEIPIYTKIGRDLCITNPGR